ncbi:MAG: ATP-binding protein, partial [Rubritepida sp.]|nr:ATP-binding protein [Rubritepida sp.]
RPEIAWETDLPAEPVIAPCDRRLINQALANLLQNAADSILLHAQQQAEQGETPRPPIGHIRVGLTAEGGMVGIHVEDDGLGLPGGEERERLTEPYVTHKPKGTGLGLAIVKKIMEDHGGRIVLGDARSGTGARAELWLPVRAAEPTEAAVMERGHGA